MHCVSSQKLGVGKSHTHKKISHFGRTQLLQTLFIYPPTLLLLLLFKATQQAYFQKGEARPQRTGKYELRSALWKQLGAHTHTHTHTHRHTDWESNPGGEGKTETNKHKEKEEVGLWHRGSLLDADMRWKSEVKVECCVVSEDESGSVLSNDEVFFFFFFFYRCCDWATPGFEVIKLKCGFGGGRPQPLSLEPVRSTRWQLGIFTIWRNVAENYPSLNSAIKTQVVNETSSPFRLAR